MSGGDQHADGGAVAEGDGWGDEYEDAVFGSAGGAGGGGGRGGVFVEWRE